MGSILKYDNNEISKLYKENSYNKLAQILKRTYKDENKLSSDLADVDETIKKLMLYPFSLSYITGVTDEDNLIFTTVISRLDSLGFYFQNTDNNESTIKLTSPDEISSYFSDLFTADETIETSTQLTMSTLGFLCLMAIGDALKRKYLEQLLFHVPDSYEVDTSEIKDVFGFSLESKDIRWFLPFITEAFGPFDNLSLGDIKNIEKGLKELENLEILKLLNQKIQFTDTGYRLLGLMLEKRNMLSFRSLFFENNQLVQMPIAFIKYDKILYYIMPVADEDKVVLKSINKEKFCELIEMVIAPGDEPEIIIKEVKEPVSDIETKLNETDKSEAPDDKHVDTKFCRYCGAKVKVSAKFCTSCGKSLVSK